MEMNGKGSKLGEIKSFAQGKVVKKWQSQLFNLHLSEVKANAHNHHSTLCLPPPCSCNSTWHESGIYKLRGFLQKQKMVPIQHCIRGELVKALFWN